MLEEWLTVHQAADVSGYHYNYIRQMIRAGKLEARKFGPVWQVSRTDLLAYIDEAKELGDSLNVRRPNSSLITDRQSPGASPRQPTHSPPPTGASPSQEPPSPSQTSIYRHGDSLS